jgi:hypothetical protein
MDLFGLLASKTFLNQVICPLSAWHRRMRVSGALCTTDNQYAHLFVRGLSTASSPASALYHLKQRHRLLSVRVHRVVVLITTGSWCGCCPDKEKAERHSETGWRSKGGRAEVADTRPAYLNRNKTASVRSAMDDRCHDLPSTIKAREE